MSEKIVDAVKKNGKCDICGRRLKIGYITDDGKTVCFSCAEDIDWAHARILRKKVRPKKYAKNHWTYNTLLEYIRKNHLDGDPKIIKIINNEMSKKSPPSFIYRKIRWYILNNMPYSKIRKLYGDCLVKYRIVKDILKKRRGEMSKEVNGVSFRYVWNSLMSKLKCDENWINNYIAARKDVILELGEGKEINYLLDLFGTSSILGVDVLKSEVSKPQTGGEEGE